MYGNSVEIERIVGLVLDRLRERSIAASDPKSQANLPVQNTPVPQATHDRPEVGILRLSDKLLTLEALDGKLEGISILQLLPRAVVTPAVLDELRQRGVRIERQTPETPTGSTDGHAQLLFIIDASKCSGGDYLGRVLAGSQDGRQDADCIAAHIHDGGQSAIWVSKRPYAAALACTGKPGIRAVQLSRCSELARAKSEADPNVFVVDALSWNKEQVCELGKLVQISPLARTSG